MATYRTHRELVDDCVKAFLGACDSALVQARGEAMGMDGIDNETAQRAAKRMWSGLTRARLFCVEPERWLGLYRAADRYTTTVLAGLEWRPFNGTLEPVEVSERQVSAYMEYGFRWPFPEPMPFEACFFSFGRKLLLRSEVAKVTRVRQEQLDLLGNPPVFLLGYLLAWEGNHPFAFSVVRFGDSEEDGSLYDGKSGVGLISCYKDGEWDLPMSLDPWIVTMLVHSVNQHKHIIQSRPIGLSHRLDRKKLAKQHRQVLPLPSPFYIVNLKDELIEAPTTKPRFRAGRPADFSHRFDVRGHECVRVERGTLPISAKDAALLLRRGYRLYEGNRLSGEDAGRLLKRDIRAPTTEEWLAVLSWWRDAYVKGPKSAPYVPASRVGV